MRQTLDITGMVGVTIFGLLLTPTFYGLCRKFGTLKSVEDKRISETTQAAPAE